MTLPVSLPIVFANQPSSTPLQLSTLDQDFNAIVNALNALATQTAAGNVTIAAPSSGFALTVLGAAGSQAISLQGASGSGVFLGLLDGNSGPQQQWYVTVGAFAASHFGIQAGGATANALDIAPTGAFTIAAPQANNVAFTVNGASGGYAGEFLGNSSAGNSYGVLIAGGTTAADICLLIQNALQTLAYLKIFGDGGIIVGNPNGGDKGIGTINVAAGLYVNGVAVTVP